MSVRLLTVPRCFGSQPFSQDSSPLRPATDVSDGDRERDHRNHGYGDNENRGHVRRLPGASHANRLGGSGAALPGLWLPQDDRPANP
jgi:hypothetical protein